MNLTIEEMKRLLGADKRKTERLRLPIKIFYCLGQANEWSGPVEAEDISGGGIKFKSKESIKKQSEFKLKIDIPGEPEPISVKAEAIYCRKVSGGYVTGARLRKMAYADRRRYVSYLCDKILLRHLDDKGAIKE